MGADSGAGIGAEPVGTLTKPAELELIHGLELELNPVRMLDSGADRD